MTTDWENQPVPPHSSGRPSSRPLSRHAAVPRARRLERIGSPVVEAWRAKAAGSAHALVRAWRRSWIRVSGMAGFGLLVGVASMVLFRAAFAFLNGLEVIGPVVLVRLLSLFFFVLFVMLVASNVLVSFQTLFRARESEAWMASPLSAAQIHDARSLEIALMSSWAFLYMGGVLLAAYGLGTGAAWPYYALVPFVLALFATCAHEVGLLVTVPLVRLFPGLDLKRLIALLLVGMAPIVVLMVRAFRVGEVRPEDDVSDLLVHVLEGLGRTQYPLLPGYWAAEALRAAATSDPRRAVFFTWALLVTAVFLGLLARAASERWLVPAWQILRGSGLARPAFGRSKRRRGTPARGPFRALASKDAALFLRDPAQWSQVGLVVLLGGVYVVNLRNLPDLRRFAPWGQVASYLNLGVLLLLVATLTTRFAFPLISMEGRRAWIVLLAPFPRERLVEQKVALALPVALVFGTACAAFSTQVLGVGPVERLVTHLAVVAGAFALTGLAVGLGALFPDFREDNPARIVSGFGGTVDFLAGVAYVLVITLTLALPDMLGALGRLAPGRVAVLRPLSWALALTVSLLVGAVPLRLGRRHLAALEM